MFEPVNRKSLEVAQFRDLLLIYSECEIGRRDLRQSEKCLDWPQRNVFWI